MEEQEGKVPKYVKMQAADWMKIADGEDEEAFVDEKEYEKVCKLLKLWFIQIYDAVFMRVWKTMHG